MSRKPQLSPTELREHVRHLTRSNTTLARELEGARTALRQQQQHIHQLVRALHSSAPAPKKAVAPC